MYLSTPWIYRLAAIAYVEGPLCFYHAALDLDCVSGSGIRLALYYVGIWGLLGLLAGCAMGCKYTGLVSAVIPFGLLSMLVAWRKRSISVVAWYVVGWAIVMVPWLAKNVVDTRNPVYPLAGRVFPGPEWDQGREAKWQAVHGPRPIELGESWRSLGDLVHGRKLRPDSFRVVREFWESLVDVAGRSDWQSPLYLALAPLAFFRRGSRRLAVWLWWFAAYLFLSWWLATHRLDRFWLPILPVLAILAGLGADWIRTRSWSVVLWVVMAIGLFANLTYVTTALAGLNEWTGDLVFLRRDIPKRWNAAMARMDAELPSGAQAALGGAGGRVSSGPQGSRTTPCSISRRSSFWRKGRRRASFATGSLEQKLTHIYVDWREIARHREPGKYGFTDFVVRDRFAGWVAAGVLSPPLGDGRGTRAVRGAEVSPSGPGNWRFIRTGVFPGPVSKYLEA